MPFQVDFKGFSEIDTANLETVIISYFLMGSGVWTTSITIRRHERLWRWVKKGSDVG
jgi:hypothetical protein